VRQLTVSVPDHLQDRVLDLADHHRARAVRTWAGRGRDVGRGPVDGEPVAVVEMSLTNRAVGRLLEDLRPLGDEVAVTFAPQSVLTVAPGRSEAPDQLVDVEALSPDEVFLAGLQSIGSWRGFLAYAAAAGAIVWIGLLLDSIVLQIAAMLIAPFAGPAMTAALATATGDAVLFGRSVLRYGAALATAIAVAAAVHALLGPETATVGMVGAANVSSVAVVLPLVAGAAGALNLMQADRSSLVPGAATGVLVAAALAPPAGTLGMALAIGRWDLVVPTAFLLGLQLAGLNVGGAVAFRAFGLSPARARYGRGDGPASLALLGASAVVVAGLVGVQLADAPSLQRSTVEQSAADRIARVVDDVDDVSLVERRVRFTRAEIEGQDTLLAEVVVQVPSGPTAPVADRLADHLARDLADDLDVTPLVSVTALVPPPVDDAAGPGGGADGSAR
jgi:uncharacterized membrane protein